MGFGILLFGYLFLTDVEVVVNMEHQIGFDVLPDVVGFILMFRALTLLQASFSAFSAPKRIIYPLFATSTTVLLCQGISFFKIAPELFSNVLEVVIPLQNAILILFHVLLFKAAKQLAKEIDLPVLAKILNRCLLLSAIFYSVHLILIFALPYSQQLGSATPFFNFTYYVSLLFQYFVLFYNIIALYKCYMFIGYEGEETPTNVKHPLQALVDKLKK